MIIAINVLNLIYTSVFLLFFLISYYVILASRIEVLFKQGSTWQIRAAQLIISFLMAYLLTEGVKLLLGSMQF